jgi:hypothetical protein
MRFEFNASIAVEDLEPVLQSLVPFLKEGSVERVTQLKISLDAWNGHTMREISYAARIQPCMLISSAAIETLKPFRLHLPQGASICDCEPDIGIGIAFIPGLCGS